MITREQFQEAFRSAMLEDHQLEVAGIQEAMLWRLFDSPEAKAREIDVTGMAPIKIQLNQAKEKEIPPIDVQMKAIAYQGRCFGGHFDANGDVNYFLANLTYRDKLVVQDVLTQNINLHFRQVNGLDEG